MSPGAVNPAKIAFCDRCVNRRSLIWITDDAAVLYQIGRSHLPGRANGLRRDDLALAITWPAPRFCGQRLIGHGRWCWTATIWRADGGLFDHHPHPQPAGAGASGCGLGAGRPVPPGGWSTMAPPRRSQRHWLNGSALRAGCWSTPAAQHRRAISARAGRGEVFFLDDDDPMVPCYTEAMLALAVAQTALTYHHSASRTLSILPRAPDTGPFHAGNAV